MSIYINKNTKVITQGITGKTGQFHTRMCRDYANGKAAFVAGVNPKKAGEDFEGIPIFANVTEAAKATGATVSVIYVPPAGAAAAIWEAVEANLDLAICITEGIPVRDMLEIRNRMKAKEAAGGKRTLLLGPNCPGLITPDEIKIGIMPGHKRGFAICVVAAHAGVELTGLAGNALRNDFGVFVDIDRHLLNSGLFNSGDDFHRGVGHGVCGNDGQAGVGQHFLAQVFVGALHAYDQRH